MIKDPISLPCFAIRPPISSRLNSHRSRRRRSRPPAAKSRSAEPPRPAESLSATSSGSSSGAHERISPVLPRFPRSARRSPAQPGPPSMTLALVATAYHHRFAQLTPCIGPKAAASSPTCSPAPGAARPTRRAPVQSLRFRKAVAHSACPPARLARCRQHHRGPGIPTAVEGKLGSPGTTIRPCRHPHRAGSRRDRWPRSRALR